MLETAGKLAGRVENLGPLLRQATGGEQFYNTSPLTMTRLLDDPPNIADNFHAYLRAFSSGAADVLEKFDLHTQVDRLERADLLYLVVSKFCEIDLHPEAVSNLEMGYLYEELIRRFSELSNETAGEHPSPPSTTALAHLVPQEAGVRVDCCRRQPGAGCRAMGEQTRLACSASVSAVRAEDTTHCYVPEQHRDPSCWRSRSHQRPTADAASGEDSTLANKPIRMLAGANTRAGHAAAVKSDPGGRGAVLAQNPPPLDVPQNLPCFRESFRMQAFAGGVLVPPRLPQPDVRHHREGHHREEHESCHGVLRAAAATGGRCCRQ